MNEHYLVTVKYLVTGENKYRRDQYLIEAMTLSDSETQMVAYFEQKGGISEYEVLSSVRKNYADILKTPNMTITDDTCYYEVDIEYDVIVESRNGDKIKHQTVKYIIVEDSLEAVNNSVTKLTADWDEASRVKSVKRTKIVDNIKLAVPA